MDPCWNKTCDSFEGAEPFILDQALYNDAEAQNDHEPILPSETSNENNDFIQMANLSKGERYLNFFHVSKSICSLASESIEQSNLLATRLDSILNNLRWLNQDSKNIGEQRNEKQDTDNENSKTIDHIDVIGKPKGRPPKMRKADEHTKPVVCLICLKAHQITRPLNGWKNLPPCGKNTPIINYSKSFDGKKRTLLNYLSN